MPGGEICAFPGLLFYATVLKYKKQEKQVGIMSKFLDKRNSDALYRAIVSIRDEEECRRFLEDLCTVSELKALAQRMDVAMLLDEGLIYSEILDKTGASSATISRVNRCLHYGAGGYQTVVARLREKKA